MAKTWKLSINEEELKALIRYHADSIGNTPSNDQSERLHDLVKRLNKTSPEIEPIEPQVTAAKEEQQSGW